MLCASACGNGGDTGTDGGPSTGGTAQPTGGRATGGAPGSGGSQATGGGQATGGSSMTGGTHGNIGGAAGGLATGGGHATGGLGGAGGSNHAGGGSAAGKGGHNAQGGLATGGTSGAGGTQATGGNHSGCDTPPSASALVGWAAVAASGVTTTTGGADTSPTTVSTASAFSSAVAGTDAAVIYVKGSLSGNFKVGSNKTIVGVCGAELHGHLELSGSVNVILRNIKVVGYGVGDCSLDPSYDSSVGCSSGQDAISVQKNAHHIWIDHADVSDGTDGNLDITNGANYVTVSWTKFHYTERTDPEGDDSTGAAGHRFSNLIGGTDSPSTYDDAHALNVTWHHNWWAERVVERQPRVRFGKNHIFNNLWSSAGDNYCVRAGKGAQILLEKNVFAGVKDPHEFNSTSDEGTANITVNENTYPGSTGSKDMGGGGPAFGSAPYTYTTEATDSLEAAIRAGAGPH